MSGPAPRATLPPAVQQMFTRGFEKDLRFFHLLLVLINKSCPIKNIDLVWTEDVSDGRTALHHVTGTSQVVKGQNPNPAFCRIVNDDGRREGESCAISDKAAELRVRQSRKTDVYRCHAGLIDIAVPVIAEGQHIATLYSGQILGAPPSKEEFVQIRQQVAHLGHVDAEALERAYFEVPVVSQEEIDETVRILEMFADYLATCWLRMSEMLLADQRRVRDLQLRRKEFAQSIIEGEFADSARLRKLAREVGFRHYPNRVLVVQPGEDRSISPDVGFDVILTRVIHAVESVCDAVDNATAAYSWRRGICVFYYEPESGSRQAGMRSYSLAQRILQTVAERADVRVRIGLGQVQSDIHKLHYSYQEARAALAESEVSIAVYERPDPFGRALFPQLDDVCRAISELRLREARAALVSLPILVSRTFGPGTEKLTGQRQFFLSALEAVLHSAQQIGHSPASVAAFRSEIVAEFGIAGNPFQLHEAWIAAAERLMAELAGLYAGKYEKLVERVKSYCDGRIENEAGGAPVSLAETARHVGVSAGHLSRVFRKVTGITFERYLMVRRVERAQRLLLDPGSRVSEVAERCRFCNPAYFARVFRKVTGCSPTEYSKNPLRSPATPQC